MSTAHWAFALLVACLLASSVSSKRCTGRGDIGGRCTEPSKCSGSNVLSGANECDAPLICCKTSRGQWNDNPVYFPKKRQWVDNSAYKPPTPLSQLVPPETATLGQAIQPQTAVVHEPEAKFLLIDGDDDTGRMNRIRTAVSAKMWNKLDVVKLKQLDFDQLTLQIRRLGREYPVVIFTMHGQNAGHPTPSVEVTGYRKSNHLVAEKVVSTSSSTARKEATVVNPLHLSDQSWENFQNADPDRPFPTTYRLGYLRALYHVVNRWQTKPLIFLSVCNSAGEALKFKPVPAQARTGVEVYYPRQCVPSYQVLDAQIWEAMMSRGDFHQNADLFTEEYERLYNQRWDHNDMANLIDLTKRDGE